MIMAMPMVAAEAFCALDQGCIVRPRARHRVDRTEQQRAGPPIGLLEEHQHTSRYSLCGPKSGNHNQ